jgi:hypothetical protein
MERLLALPQLKIKVILGITQLVRRLKEEPYKNARVAKPLGIVKY